MRMWSGLSVKNWAMATANTPAKPCTTAVTADAVRMVVVVRTAGPAGHVLFAMENVYD